MDLMSCLFTYYYSTHYKHFMPKGIADWSWELKRIELNFGKDFSAFSKDRHLLDLGCGVGYLEDYLIRKGFRN